MVRTRSLSLILDVYVDYYGHHPEHVRDLQWEAIQYKIKYGVDSVPTISNVVQRSTLPAWARDVF